ncbi:MAG: ABC transporter substrate-binding protein [Rectinemataceae bacterium]
MRSRLFVVLAALALASSVLIPISAQAAPAAGQRVLRVTFSWPNTIDPAIGNDYASTSSIVNLYDTLVFPNAKGGIDPWLAASWTISRDGLTYSFRLRRDAVFHDGAPLKASDVVYSFNRLKTIGRGFAYLVTPNIANVEASDPHTVVFTLRKPSALFLTSLVHLGVAEASLIKKNAKAQGPYGADGDYGTAWLQTHDAGSGPYMVKEFPLEQYLLMTKNGKWWGMFNAKAPDLVRFIGTTEGVTVRTMMQNKELEITDQWQTYEAYQALEKIPGVKIAPLPSMTSFFYMMNTKKAPTDDLHFRLAMEYGFDYDTAIGLEWPGTKQMAGPVNAFLAGFDSNLAVYKHDPARAKEELQKSKYANELGTTPVVLQWVSEVPDEEKYALLFQSNMADIGIKVDVVKVPWLSLVENTSKLVSSPNIATIYVSSDLPEAGLMLKQRYSSSTAGTWQQNEWLQDKHLDAEIDDALATLDTAQRYAKYHRIQEELVATAPTIWIYDQIEKHAYRDNIDWPAARNETSLIQGYAFFAADIGVNP